MAARLWVFGTAGAVQQRKDSTNQRPRALSDGRSWPLVVLERLVLAVPRSRGPLEVDLFGHHVVDGTGLDGQIASDAIKG